MKSYQWAVIGAGPAGIAALGKLLDHDIPAHDIAWIDPHFTVGDFGTIWRNVPSNTKVNLFLKFLLEVKAFDYKNCPEHFALNDADKNKTCELSLMADPLQWVSNHLKNSVHAIESTAEKLFMSHSLWQIQLKNHDAISAKNVILAIGSKPKRLPFSTDIVTIPLQDAMDSRRIKSHIEADHTIAVFGSSHSAILALRNLVEGKVKKIINFYRSPLRYAVYYDDWILFDDSGLKGPTAEWARQYVDGELPHNVERLYSNTENLNERLSECDKAVYAVGFEKRTLPIIENIEHIKYVEECGIIAPGLFGLGIAFPEAKTNPLGFVEYRVGLWKFMDYLNRVMPIWLTYTGK
jgi:cation diffusion facilitator CzcD-associated flavoprotein CzcO